MAHLNQDHYMEAYAQRTLGEILAERQQDLAILIELEHLMRAVVREPQESVFVDRQLVRADEQASADVLQHLAGRIELGKEERSLTFVPERPWQAKPYQVVVDGRLEDLAGNTPEGLFDVDNEAPGAEASRLTLTFRPRGR